MDLQNLASLSLTPSIDRQQHAFLCEGAKAEIMQKEIICFCERSNS